MVEGPSDLEELTLLRYFWLRHRIIVAKLNRQLTIGRFTTCTLRRIFGGKCRLLSHVVVP